MAIPHVAGATPPDVDDDSERARGCQGAQAVVGDMSAAPCNWPSDSRGCGGGLRAVRHELRPTRAVRDLGGAGAMGSHGQSRTFHFCYSPELVAALERRRVRGRWAETRGIAERNAAITAAGRFKVDAQGSGAAAAWHAVPPLRAEVIWCPPRDPNRPPPVPLAGAAAAPAVATDAYAHAAEPDGAAAGPPSSPDHPSARGTPSEALDSADGGRLPPAHTPSAGSPPPGRRCEIETARRVHVAIGKDGGGVAVDLVRPAHHDGPSRAVWRRHDRTEVAVANVDTLSAALELGDASALCFANAETPGGGYLHGARAQEEDMCRLLPQLHPALVGSGAYPLNPRSAVLVRGLAAVRKVGSYKLCASQGEVTVITAAMPCGAADRRPKGGWLGSAWAADVSARICAVLHAARVAGHPNLVLGAFGCGAFGNPPGPVATLFKRELQHPEFAGAFAKVVFAVLDPLGTGNLGPFRRELGSGRAWM